MAQFVIENSGSLNDTSQQVSRIHRRLSSSYFHWKIRFFLGVAIGGFVGAVYYVAKKLSTIVSSELIGQTVDNWQPLYLNYK